MEEKPKELPAKEPREASYTFTFTVARKGPSLASKENWVEFKRTVQTRHLSMALLGATVLFLLLLLVDRIHAPKPLNLPPPGAESAKVPAEASGPTSLGQDNDVITPLNARDPSALVMPPSR